MTTNKATKQRFVLQMQAFYEKLPRNEKTGRMTHVTMAVWRAWLAQQDISESRARQLMCDEKNPPALKINPEREQQYIAYLTARGYTVTNK